MTNQTLGEKFTRVKGYFSQEDEKLRSNQRFWNQPYKNWIGYTIAALDKLERDTNITAEKKEEILNRYQNFIDLMQETPGQSPSAHSTTNPLLSEEDPNATNNLPELFQSYIRLSSSLRSVLVVGNPALNLLYISATTLVATLASIVQVFAPEKINLMLFNHEPASSTNRSQPSPRMR
jgi:hypothetical protein